GGGITNASVTIVLREHHDRVALIRERIRPHLREIPDVRATFGNAGFGGSMMQVVLTSETGAGLDRAALQILDEMRAIPGIADPRTTDPPPGPELVVRPRPDQAARLGVSPFVIAAAARVATVGDIDANVPKLNDGERRIPIRVRLPQSARADLATIRNLRLPTASGGFTTLDTVADVYFQAGPAEIDRFDRKRNLIITADLPGGASQLASVLGQVNQLPAMRNLPPGVSTARQGQEQAVFQLFAGFIIALFTGISLVYAVM